MENHGGTEVDVMSVSSHTMMKIERGVVGFSLHHRNAS